MKLPMILLWKAVLLEVVVQGVQALPKSSDLLKILVQMAPNVAWLQKMAPKVCKKTHEDLFCRWHREKFFIIFWGKICWQKLHKNVFGQVWGNTDKKILHTHQNLPARAPMKRNLHPVAHLLKEQRGNAPAMPIFSGVPVHVILHALFTRCCKLQCATIMNINDQRSPDTKQFITGGRTHPVLRQRRSQLQKDNADQMSPRIAVEQK